jgi:hypothetical protein
MMKCIISFLGVSFLFIQFVAASHEQSVFARVTVYWRSEGSGEHAASNGCRLREGHCAVDPKKIPFGSQVVFDDIACIAVDSGPAVVSRKAARLTGRNARERNALVIDRFFETKKSAMAWAASHPHFVNVWIVAPNSPVPPKSDLQLAAIDKKKTVASSSSVSAPRNQPPIASTPNSAPWYYARRRS